jgi:hypothetical protein
MRDGTASCGVAFFTSTSKLHVPAHVAPTGRRGRAASLFKCHLDVFAVQALRGLSSTQRLATRHPPEMRARSYSSCPRTIGDEKTCMHCRNPTRSCLSSSATPRS